MLDNGRIFCGRAYRLNFEDIHVYVMIGADNTICWVKLTRDELKNEEPYLKVGRIGVFSFPCILFELEN